MCLAPPGSQTLTAASCVGQVAGRRLLVWDGDRGSRVCLKLSSFLAPFSEPEPSGTSLQLQIKSDSPGAAQVSLSAGPVPSTDLCWDLGVKLLLECLTYALCCSLASGSKERRASQLACPVSLCISSLAIQKNVSQDSSRSYSEETVQVTVAV